MFLKNKNIIFKIRRSKVTDYAALNGTCKINALESGFQWGKCVVKILSHLVYVLSVFYPFKLNGISTFVNWPSPFPFKGLF